MILKKIENFLLDVLFPPICLNCRKYPENGGLLCDACYSLIKVNNTAFCAVCRGRLPENKNHCHRPLFLLAAATDYDDPVVRDLIRHFKYKNFRGAAEILGEILNEYLKNLLGNGGFKIENSIVVPIPLHPNRERKRGFNQSKLLAEAIAKNFNLELREPLERIKNNKPQIEMKDDEARQKNINGCFKLADGAEIKGENILLVDDVFTSGATMNEAAKILKEKGVGKIIVLVAAKA